MSHSKFTIPRWLFGLEILVCLIPVTLFWAAAMNAVLRGVQAPSILVPAILGTLGPLSLLLALGAVQRASASRSMFTVLAASFAALAAIQVIEPDAAWFAFDWRVLLLNSVLPCLACAHLALVAPGNDRASALAV